MASGSKFFLTIFWVLRTGLASQALRKLFAGRTAWPAFRAKARNHNFLFWVQQPWPASEIQAVTACQGALLLGFSPAL